MPPLSPQSPQSPRSQRLVLVAAPGAHATRLAKLLRAGTPAPALVVLADLDDALRHLAHHSADCVLLDFGLAGGAGLAGLKRVLAVAPAVPVVVLAEEHDQALALRLIRTGAQDVLVRGTEGDGALMRTIRHAVERRRTGEREEVARLVREVAAGAASTWTPADAGHGPRVRLPAALAGVLLVFALQVALGLRLGGSLQLLYALPVALAAAASLRRGLLVGAVAVVLAGIWGLVHVPDQLHLLAAAVRALALGAVAVGVDRAQNRAHDGAHLLRAVIGSTTDCVFVRDVEGRYVLVNQAVCELIGRPEAEILGRRPQELVDAETARLWSAWDDTVLATGRTHRYWRTVALGGVERALSTVKAPLRDGRGHIAGIVGITRDETDVRRLEDESSRFFELAPDMLCTARPDGRLERVNSAWTATLGWSAEELRSQDILAFVHPADRELARRDLLALFAGERDGCATRLATKAGGWRDIEWTGRAVAGGGAFVAARDVTERNELARALRAGEARYRALAESLPGSFVLSFDHDLRFTFAAGAPLAELGLEGQLVGRTLAEAVVPEAAQRLGPRFRSALGGHGQSFEHEVQSGRTFWLQVVPSLDEDGFTVGGMVIGQDIEGLRRAEREVARAEERFRAAFEQAPIGMAIIELDGTLRRVNEALGRVLGAEPASLAGTPFDAGVHPEHVATVHEQWAALLSGAVAAHAAEHRWRSTDGTELWLAVRATLVRDDAATPAHVLAQIQDVTEGRRLEATLRHQADHDALTGLLNRRRFETDLEDHAEAGAAGAVLLVDLDGFKEVNDQHGHAAGDALLVRVADLLVATLGAGARVARLGGDEFAALLAEASPQEAEWAAERLVHAVRTAAGREITASVGVAGFASPGRRGEEVLAHADLALYGVKAAGRDGWGSVQS